MLCNKLCCHILFTDICLDETITKRAGLWLEVTLMYGWHGTVIGNQNGIYAIVVDNTGELLSRTLISLSAKLIYSMAILNYILRNNDYIKSKLFNMVGGACVGGESFSAGSAHSLIISTNTY